MGGDMHKRPYLKVLGPSRAQLTVSRAFGGEDASGQQTEHSHSRESFSTAFSYTLGVFWEMIRPLY